MKSALTGGFPSQRSSGVETWWRHQMETFSMLLAICAGNSLVPGEFPAQRPVTQSFDVFFDLCLSKQSWGWWFETLSHPLWCHRNECVYFIASSLLWKIIQGKVWDCLSCFAIYALNMTINFMLGWTHKPTILAYTVESYLIYSKPFYKHQVIFWQLIYLYLSHTGIYIYTICHSPPVRARYGMPF